MTYQKLFQRSSNLFRTMYIHFVVTSIFYERSRFTKDAEADATKDQNFLVAYKGSIKIMRCLNNVIEYGRIRRVVSTPILTRSQTSCSVIYEAESAVLALYIFPVFLIWKVSALSHCLELRRSASFRAIFSRRF